MSKRRAQTSTERDLDGMAAKKEREAAPSEIEDESSAACSHDPDLLRQYRSKRSTQKRLEILETKHDELQSRYDRLVNNVLASRTKIIVAIVGAGGVALGYLVGACA